MHVGRTCARSTSTTSRSMLALRGAPAARPTPTPPRSCASKPRWPGRRSIASSRRDPERGLPQDDAGELQALTPQLRLDALLPRHRRAADRRASTSPSPTSSRRSTRCSRRPPLDDLKAYLRWQLVHANAAVLSKAFVDENFEFYGADAAAAPENSCRGGSAASAHRRRSRRGARQGVRQGSFGPQAKADTLKMVARRSRRRSRRTSTASTG